MVFVDFFKMFYYDIVWYRVVYRKFLLCIISLIYEDLIGGIFIIRRDNSYVVFVLFGGILGMNDIELFKRFVYYD